MKVHFLPKTALGKWSTGLIIAFFLFVAVCLIQVALGQGGGDTFFSNLTLGIPGLLAGVSALSALVTGIIGIVKSRERSALVFLATALGLYMLLVALGEILIPH